MSWHQDSDRWIWRVYEAGESSAGAVSQKGKEDTTDIYIIPIENQWWVVNAKKLYDEHRQDWVQRVQEGKAVPVAGPFAHENDAKAAWRLIYG